MNQFVKRVGEKRCEASHLISFPHLVEKPILQKHKYIRLCFSYDLLNAIYHLQSLFISMKICISVTDVVLTLLVPSECYVTCGHNRESPAQFENQIKSRMYVRRISRSTMYEKAPFCLNRFQVV